MRGIRCGFFYVPLIGEESTDEAYSCEAEAEYTCCNYGGAVCAAHRCRCSKLLTVEQREAREVENTAESNDDVQTEEGDDGLY